MKNIVNSILLCLVVFSITGCTDDKDPIINNLTKADGSPISFVLNATANSSYTLLAENATAVVDTLTCEQPDYGFSAAVTYTVDISEAGNDFATYASLATTGQGEKIVIKTFELNDAMTTLGMSNPAVTYSIDVRLRAAVNDSVPKLTSNTISLSVTPYSGSRTPVYFVGNILDNEWNNNDPGMMLFAENDMNDMSYTYTGYVKAGSEFKIIQNLGDWAVQWGYASDGKLSQDGGSGNIGGFTANGYYTISLDLSNNTYSIEPYDNTPAEYNQISFIGAFNNWGGDLDLTQSTYDKHIWVGQNIEIPSDGELKLRVNHDWGASFGGSNSLWSEKQGEFAKFDGGDNVTVKAGTYFVKFNDISKHIILIAK